MSATPIHVVPETSSDERMHELNDLADCWCHPLNEFPTVNGRNEWRVVHKTGPASTEGATE